ncbi:MAG: hypothetical protein QGH74_03465 [Candidatus Brocadiia bacterium]|nr:hypothetical protein [Candidatus Brocadiia bacterium]
MALYARSAMTRCGGLLIVYAAVIVLLASPPEAWPLQLVAALVMAAIGCALARRRQRWHCPQCGHQQAAMPTRPPGD